MGVMEKTKPSGSTIVIVIAALVVCLMCAFTPMAYAADNTTLTAGKAAFTTQAETTAETPTLKTVSKVKVTFTNGKTYYEKWVSDSKSDPRPFMLSWKAPKKVKGLEKLTYNVRYTSGLADPYYGKTKTTRKTSIKLPAFDDGYGTVQIRASAKYGKKTVHSKWRTYLVSADGYSKTSTNASGTWMYLNKYRATIEDWDDGKVGSWEASKQSRAPLSIKLTSTSPGSVEVSWKEPKKAGSEDNPTPQYAVKYSYSKNMKNAKYKYDIEDESIALKNLKKGKKLYVSVAAEAQYYYILDGWHPYEIVSRWTKTKAITVAKK